METALPRGTDKLLWNSGHPGGWGGSPLPQLTSPTNFLWSPQEQQMLRMSDIDRKFTDNLPKAHCIDREIGAQRK